MKSFLLVGLYPLVDVYECSMNVAVTGEERRGLQLAVVQLQQYV